MSSPPPEPARWPPDLARILAAARERSGVDFGGYRPSILQRRVQSRMVTVSATSYRDYLRRLREQPDEVDLLLQRLTIKVSRFFRNAETYCQLRDVLRDWRTAVHPEPLRIWSAGCGHGEEPYSLAMLLADLPGPAPAGSICATDVDEVALETARIRCYPPEAVEEMPPDLLSRYLEGSRDRRRPHRVAEAIASVVSFLPHDLTSATRPPKEGGFHLICCRNVLIYLTPAVQRRVVELLLSSLVPGGHLCLGRAELPPSSLLSRLETVDRAAHIYRLERARAPAPRGTA